LKKRKREAVPRKEDGTLINPDQRKNHRYSKSNRLKKQERKLIQMNPRYHFFMSEDGCVYYLKDESNE